MVHMSYLKIPDYLQTLSHQWIRRRNWPMRTRYFPWLIGELEEIRRERETEEKVFEKKMGLLRTNLILNTVRKISYSVSKAIDDESLLCFINYEGFWLHCRWTFNLIPYLSWFIESSNRWNYSKNRFGPCYRTFCQQECKIKWKRILTRFIIPKEIGYYEQRFCFEQLSSFKEMFQLLGD